MLTNDSVEILKLWNVYNEDCCRHGASYFFYTQRQRNGATWMLELLHAFWKWMSLLIFINMVRACICICCCRRKEKSNMVALSPVAHWLVTTHIPQTIFARCGLAAVWTLLRFAIFLTIIRFRFPPQCALCFKGIKKLQYAGSALADFCCWYLISCLKKTAKCLNVHVFFWLIFHFI